MAERASKGATIHIHEIVSDRRKRKKLVQCNEIQSKEIISVKFSADGKYILALGGSPDWAILNIHREKAKVVNVIKVTKH